MEKILGLTFAEALNGNDMEVNYFFENYYRLMLSQKNLPAGMKAVGGIGNGVFEISEDIVGLEYLPFMQADDTELFDMLYRRIGDLMFGISVSWLEFCS